MSELAIPASIAEVTADWLTEVLRRSGEIGDGYVERFTASQIGAGVGIMGELFKVTPEYKGAPAGAPSTVVVKLPSPYEQNRAQGVALGMYEAEVRFYNELAPATSMRLPKVHHATIVPGTADFVVVLEDLGDLDMPDEVAGMDLDQAQAAVRALAHLHASWWGRVDGAAHEWIPTLDSPRIQAIAQVYPMLWQGFLAKFAGVLPEGAAAAGDVIAPRWGELMAWLARRPMTLLHQDFRCENMFFATGIEDPHGVVVIDWQALGRGPGAYDLSYLLGGSLPTDVRRAEEGSLTRLYHDTLRANGVTDYGYDELWRDYRFASMVVTSTPVFTGSQLDLANERGRALIGGMGARMLGAVVDHDATSLMP